MPDQKIIDRDTYRAIKKMSREELQAFLMRYANGLLENDEAACVVQWPEGKTSAPGMWLAFDRDLAFFQRRGGDGMSDISCCFCDTCRDKDTAVCLECASWEGVPDKYEEETA